MASTNSTLTLYYFSNFGLTLKTIIVCACEIDQYHLNKNVYVIYYYYKIYWYCHQNYPYNPTDFSHNNILCKLVMKTYCTS